MEAFGHTKKIYKYMPTSLATYIPYKNTENVIVGAQIALD